MRPTRPVMHSFQIPIATAIAIALCTAPLLASAQAYGPDATLGAQADATESESASAQIAPPPQKSAQPKKSLMGVVMAALIESAEQSARHRRDAARRAAGLDQMRPSASTDAVTQPDPASVISREGASREQVAVQDDPL